MVEISAMIDAFASKILTSAVKERLLISCQDGS